LGFESERETQKRAVVVDRRQWFATADDLMYELEYYIYHGGYGPTNETLGKFIRELFGQQSPPAAAIRNNNADLLEHTVLLKAKG